jgi:hypothetical protein
VRARGFPRSKLALWQRSSFDVLTSDVVASRHPGPAPPPEWTPALHQLVELSRKPVPAPARWTPMAATTSPEPLACRHDRDADQPTFPALDVMPPADLRDGAQKDFPKKIGNVLVGPQDRMEHLEHTVRMLVVEGGGRARPIRTPEHNLPAVIGFAGYELAVAASGCEGESGKAASI